MRDVNSVSFKQIWRRNSYRESLESRTTVRAFHSSRRLWPLVEPMVQLEASHDAGSDDTDPTDPCSSLRALAELIEPAAALVSSTARGDPALALVADPTAAGSASQTAALASERLERMASTLAALPVNLRYPPRRYQDARPGNTLRESSPEMRTPPPTTSRKPLIIEIVDEDVTPSAPEDDKAAQPATSTSGREDEYLSVASIAALAAAAYVSGAELHGVDALPGWSSLSAATAARALLQRAFGSETERAPSDTLDEQARENLARCLGESAPVLAHCLACAPEPRWGAEPEEDDRREPRPPAPELPPELAEAAQPASAESALVAATRLRRLIEMAGYPWIGRIEGVVSRVVPCVLRAMDHKNASVRREGCAALVAFVASVTRTELRWHGAALLDAAASTLSASTPEVFGTAAAAHVRTALAVCSDDTRDPGLMTAFTAILDAANSRGHEPEVAAAWVAEVPPLIAALKLSVASHLDRLFPPLLSWLHARDDAVACGAASCLELVCRMTWPRVPGHAVSLWPDIARAYAEADARSVADELRTELERLAAVLQLAAGDAFEAVWSRSKNGPVPSELEPLIAYLESLPAREERGKWTVPQ